MAAYTGRPYGYYASKADTTLPRVASEIAVPFHEVWWTDARFEESRTIYADSVTTREGPLKVEVARYIEGAVDALPADGPKAHELALLGDAVIDGVITTNYDPLLERVFPDFAAYVGQDELLFSDPKGVGEIYKIHGSVTRPESIVLTEGDYAQFNARNPYLAAKLLTIFVEHPVVFLGYSLNDPNVTEILVSIARVLTTENLGVIPGHVVDEDAHRGAAVE
jgi:SIR2-like domain